ncbi:MAG: sigma-70 family RNA polymerase sigma factor [Patescibacteria group bacterium]
MKQEFLAVYDQYADDIFRYCVLKVSGRTVAEDLTQEVFMRYWQQLRKGTSIVNGRALLYAMARNLIIDWYRRKKEQSLEVLTEEGYQFPSNDEGTIEQHAQLREVLDVIKDLDETSREALTLRFVEGFSPKEIAALSGESANAVSVRINRALKKVQDHLHTHD